MKNLIEVQNLCKRYGDFTLQNIHLSVPTGCIVGLIGENGAGKTTTLKAILNIIRPDPVSYTHLDVYKRQPTTRSMLGS